MGSMGGGRGESLADSRGATPRCLLEGTLGRNRWYLEEAWREFKKCAVLSSTPPTSSQISNVEGVRCHCDPRGPASPAGDPRATGSTPGLTRRGSRAPADTLPCTRDPSWEGQHRVASPRGSLGDVQQDVGSLLTPQVKGGPAGSRVQVSPPWGQGREQSGAGWEGVGGVWGFISSQSHSLWTPLCVANHTSYLPRVPHSWCVRLWT